MPPNREERRALAQQFASDVRRMRDCLKTEDHALVTDDELVRAWTAYSDGLCAIWLGLPEDDAALLSILRAHLPQVSASNTIPATWQARILDAGDGTGDGILELPDALMAQLGWEIGDRLDISLNDAGHIVLRKAD